MADFNLSRNLAQLEDRKAQLAAYKKHSASLQSKIDALAHPAPLQVAEREQEQSRLADLARKHLENDRLADAALQDLRQLLEKRAGLTASMVLTASAVELTIGEDALDEGRFKSLLDLLPAELAATSERWVDWILGTEGNKQCYVVRAKTLVLPETVASNHLYRTGDRIDLTEEQTRKLLSDSPRNARAIITLEAAEAEAEKAAIPA
jgi:hypothetical protein